MPSLFESNSPEILESIAKEQKLIPDTEEKLKKAIIEFIEIFNSK